MSKTVRQFTRPVVLLCCVAALSGCEAFGWFAYGVAGDPPPLDVKAEYRGLDHQQIVVIVDADLQTLYRYPAAPLEVCTTLSNAMAEHVPGAVVVNPRQVVEFQERNIYWNTLTYQEMAATFNATRLVMIDLIEYRSHEPGDRTMWRGQITADVRIAEVDGPTPNDMAYGTTVSVTYPPDQQFGVVNADELTIRKATLDLFTLAAVGKFHDHKEERE